MRMGATTDTEWVSARSLGLDVDLTKRVLIEKL